MSTPSGHPDLDLPYEGKLGTIGKTCWLSFKIYKSVNDNLARSTIHMNGQFLCCPFSLGGGFHRRRFRLPESLSTLGNTTAWSFVSLTQFS